MLAAVYRSVLFHDDSKLFVFGYIAAAVVLAIWLGLFWLAAVVMLHLLLEIVKQHHYDPRPLPVLARSFWELKLDFGLVVCGLVIGLYIDVVFGIAGLGAAGRAGAQAAARVGLWQRGIRGMMLTLDDVAIVAKARGVGKREKASGEPELATAGARAEAEADAAGSGRRAGVDSGAVAGGAGVSEMADVTDSADDRAPAETAADVDASAASGSDDGRAIPGEIEPPHRPPAPPSSGPALWGGWAAERWSRGDWASLGFTVANVLLIVAAPLLTEASMGEVWADILADLHPFPDH